MNITCSYEMTFTILDPKRDSYFFLHTMWIPIYKMFCCFLTQHQFLLFIDLKSERFGWPAVSWPGQKLLHELRLSSSSFDNFSFLFFLNRFLYLFSEKTKNAWVYCNLLRIMYLSWQIKLLRWKRCYWSNQRKLQQRKMKRCEAVYQ